MGENRKESKLGSKDRMFKLGRDNVGARLEDGQVGIKACVNNDYNREE